MTQGQTVIRAGSFEFTRKEQTEVSDLARNIFGVSKVTRVFFGLNYISVAVEEESLWGSKEEEVKQVISQYFDAKLPVFNREVTCPPVAEDSDSEVVQFIKEIIETRIRAIGTNSFTHRIY